MWSSAAEEASKEAWIKLLIFPRRILPANAPKRSANQALKVAVKERLQRWHAREEAVLWVEAARATNPRARRGRKHGNPTEDTEEQERVRRNAERARTKAGEG